MDSIVNSLMKQLATKDNLSTIAKFVGGDEEGVQSALSMGLPMLLGSMANSSSTQSGVGLLTKMIGQSGVKKPLG